MSYCRFSDPYANMHKMINNVELWATYSVLNESKDKMKAYLTSLSSVDLQEIIHTLDLASCHTESYMINACVDGYYNKFYFVNDYPSRYNEINRLNEFKQFLRTNMLVLNARSVISLLVQNGMRNFQYMFGDSIHITDIISTPGIPTLYSLTNMSYIQSIVADEYASYIFAHHSNPRIPFAHAYRETILHYFNTKFHRDFVDFVRFYFTDQMNTDLYQFTEVILNALYADEEETEEEGDDDDDDYLDYNTLYDILIPQDIKLNILYDKDLVLEDECYICSNAKVNIQLKCMHTLCDSCIDKMVTCAKSNNKICLNCPFCKASIKDIITNNELLQYGLE